MADGSEHGTQKGAAAPGSARARARQRRRADALRANLARRKTQARQRSAADGAEPAPPDSAGGSRSGGGAGR